MHTITLVFAKQTVLQLFAICARNSPRCTFRRYCGFLHSFPMPTSQCIGHMFVELFRLVALTADSDRILGSICGVRCYNRRIHSCTSWFHLYGLNMSLMTKTPIIIAFYARFFGILAGDICSVAPLETSNYSFSRDRIITQTREVLIEVSSPEPGLGRLFCVDQMYG
ncbi:uncharacterized protein BDR25DRAFT_363555 [Lindgomyces ingoldianus]|uniref:Uncharacterized protein n=1 Tax=Lindgomyces ingoldianus TaxID=673940 RepID=A0ACB6Q7M5_9PLEO|nr:uncharacterized protein BDR25DRAFT_363555 [Lindgomyces ingoldianus]KAF2462810.1 hypothetical protein BDR25DRAFT_363555 [Lindgomyces ingoldianus]